MRSRSEQGGRSTQQTGRLGLTVGAYALGFLLTVVVLLLPITGAAEEREGSRDAAQMVKEGDVSKWLEYYERERRGASTPSEPPADAAREAPADASNKTEAGAERRP